MLLDSEDRSVPEDQVLAKEKTGRTCADGFAAMRHVRLSDGFNWGISVLPQPPKAGPYDHHIMTLIDTLKPKP